MKAHKTINLIALCALFAACGCDYFGTSDPSDRLIDLPIRFGRADYDVLTRASTTYEIPDTNDFILTVKSSDGTTVYHGAYGAAPEKFSLKEGAYTVGVVSEEISLPEFNAPVFGDEKCIVLSSDGPAGVTLECSQINAGIKLNIDKAFLTSYPRSALFVKEGTGKLLYSYSEKRIAYFDPGDISIMMTTSGESDRILYTRYVGKSEILTVDVETGTGKTPSVTGGGLSIGIDTTRVWMDDFLNLSDLTGGYAPGADKSTALDVTSARNQIGAKGVWVYGYIVGGDLTSAASGIRTAPPFTAESNIAIAGKSSVSTKASCLSVQLSSGSARDALNLARHPENLGHKVFMKGDIVASYFNIPGIKNISEWQLK